MIVWEPTEGKAQFIRLLCRQRQGAWAGCRLLDSSPHVQAVHALVVKNEYAFISRWFPVHLCVRELFQIRTQYIDQALDRSFVGLLAKPYQTTRYRTSRPAAIRKLANQPAYRHPMSLPSIGSIKSQPLFDVYVPMHLSMAVDLEACLDALAPTMTATEILAKLEAFFATHALRDEEVETQKQIALEPVDGFHNDFSNQVLSQLVRTLTLCLK